MGIVGKDCAQKEQICRDRASLIPLLIENNFFYNVFHKMTKSVIVFLALLKLVDQDAIKLINKLKRGTLWDKYN